MGAILGVGGSELRCEYTLRRLVVVVATRLGGKYQQVVLSCDKIRKGKVR